MWISLFIIGIFLLSMISEERRTAEEYKAVENTPPEVIKGGEKSVQLQIHCYYVWINNNPPLCDTMLVWSTSPFNEMTITCNNRPPEISVLAWYKSFSTGWYTFSSANLTNYVQSHIGDTIPFCIYIKNRNGGVCDLVWFLSSKEYRGGGYAPKLIYNSTTYSCIGDAWVTDGYPYGPNSNYGAAPEMYVCSCTLTCASGTPPDCNGGNYESGTQFAYVEFYIQSPSLVEEKRSGFIFEVRPNSFFSSARIRYAVPRNEENVVLKVYNVMGALVKTLVNETQVVGEYEVLWDGKDEQGNKLSNGYYFYRLDIGKRKFTAKSLLLRM